MCSTNRRIRIALSALGMGLASLLAGCDTFGQGGDDIDPIHARSSQENQSAGGFRGTTDSTTVGGGLSGNAGTGGSAPTGGADSSPPPIAPR